MTRFNKGDEVSYVGGQSGKVIACIVDGVATNGDVWVVWKSDGQTLRQMKPSQLTLIQSAPKTATAIKKPHTFRYTCLECGAKHNGTCSLCGSQERILNTANDLDMSVLLGGTSTEHYAPGE